MPWNFDGYAIQIKNEVKPMTMALVLFENTGKKHKKLLLYYS
jgi:hypothetical protein